MNIRNSILIFTIINTVTAIKKNYDGYALYKVVPKDDGEVKILEEVRMKNLGEFWSDSFNVNNDVKVMVSPEKKEDFLQHLKTENVEVTEVIKDIQKVIDDQLKPTNARSNSSYLSYSWSEYHDLNAIYNWLDELAANHPNVARTVVMGIRTVQNREIKGIILNHRPGNNNTLYGILEGTLHAREWISAATVTWIIKEFLISTDPEVRALAETFEWHIFPVVNPDGYVYTFTDNRMWRKNRSLANSTICAAGIDNDMSNGVDLNRNFDFQWMTVGASNNSCTNTFAGPSAFSEPETRAIAQYVQNLRARGEIMYYIAFHSYSQLIIVPYSHVSSQDALLSGNYADMYEIAIRGSDAMRRRFGTQYRVGLSANVMYPMSGASFDWVKYAINVPIVYLFELRDLGDYGFLLPADQIIPTGLETMDTFVEMDKTARRLGYYSGATSVAHSMATLLISIFLVLVR